MRMDYAETYAETPRCPPHGQNIHSALFGAAFHLEQAIAGVGLQTMRNLYGKRQLRITKALSSRLWPSSRNLKQCQTVTRFTKPIDKLGVSTPRLAQGAKCEERLCGTAMRRGMRMGAMCEENHYGCQQTPQNAQGVAPK